jgi:hypothetical protein
LLQLEDHGRLALSYGHAIAAAKLSPDCIILLLQKTIVAVRIGPEVQAVLRRQLGRLMAFRHGVIIRLTDPLC